MLRVTCAACGRKMKAEDRHAGKRVACPGCQAAVVLPEAPPATIDQDSISDWLGEEDRPGASKEAGSSSEEPGDFEDWLASGAALDPAATSAFPATDDDPAEGELPPPPAPVRRGARGLGLSSAAPDERWEGDGPAPPRVIARTKRTKASRSDDDERSPGPRTLSAGQTWYHWAFLACLLPLAIATVLTERPVRDRLEETLEKHPEIRATVAANGEGDPFQLLPDHRIEGAHLARDSKLHWLYAGLSAALFLVLVMAMSRGADVGAGQVLAAWIATGTVGILLLLGLQWLAAWTQTFNISGRSIIVLLFYILKFIGFSYRCAVDPEIGFGLSVMGFTCGVGLCEELCKAIPVVYYLRTSASPTWKGAMLVGIASGVGFGISEGITYSGDMYNGVATGTIYVVRFLSCVALHSIWAGSVALLIYNNQDYIGELDWENVLGFVLSYLSIAMVLHGFYDALLKHDHELFALVVAAGSFGWLSWILGRTRSVELA